LNPRPAARLLAAALLALALAAPAAMPAAAQAPALPIPLPPGVYHGEVRPGLDTGGAWSWSDHPYWVPLEAPLAVVAADDLVFANWSGPVSVEVQTPDGSFSRIVMRVDVWLESVVPGRPAVQYDRPLWIWVDGVPAYVGTTVQRYSQAAFSDVTHLYPLLVGGGNATVTVALPNWVLPGWGLTGAFHVRVTLLYYPGPKPPVPTAVIPLFDNSTATPWPGLAKAVLTSSNPVAWQVTSVPENTVRAYLLVYLEGSSYDEFWYYNIPADRYAIFRSDGQVFAFTQPFPYMFTGSLNPLLWRPLPGVRALSFEPHLIDVTPLLPLIAGTHNLSVEVFNNQHYWHVFAALLLYTEPNAVVGYQLLDYQYTGPLRSENQTQTPGGDQVYQVESNASLHASSLITVVRFPMPYAFVVNASMYNSLQATQVYNDVWSNLTLAEEWEYTSNVTSVMPPYMEPVVSYNWGESWSATLNSQYGFVIEAPDTGEYPVEGNFTLWTTVNETLTIDRGVWPFTGTHRSLEEAVNATGYIEGTIMLISPTAGIITGITATYGDTHRLTHGHEEGQPSAGFDFSRYTHAGNEWPQWQVYEDQITIVIGGGQGGQQPQPPAPPVPPGPPGGPRRPLL